MMDFNRERDWALYRKSTGGVWVTHWYRDNLDTFEHDGVTYTREGPIVKARSYKGAWDAFIAARRSEEATQ